jgi:hypothetical protein
VCSSLEQHRDRTCSLTLEPGRSVRASRILDLYIPAWVLCEAALIGVRINLSWLNCHPLGRPFHHGSARVRIWTCEVKVRWTGHLSAIASSLRRCSAESSPRSFISTSI